MKTLLIAGLLLLMGFPCPTRSEITAIEGTVETFIKIKRIGFECGPAITDKCEVGQPCFATIVVTGPPAKALYEVMRKHPIKSDVIKGTSYFGTNNDKMRCEADGSLYSCSIGYDVVANSLSAIPIFDCE